MNVRKIVMNSLRMLFLAAGAALAAPLVVAPGQAQAQINLDLDIGMAPPAVREEVIPAPPPSPALWVWERGFWRWNRETGAHVWIPGRYIRLPHPGAVRVPAEWVQTPSGRWRFVPAHWQ